MDSSNKVKVYTMSYCPYCTRAKQLLSKRGIQFEEIMVGEDDDAQWDALYKLSGMRTMPQIFNGDQLIGGYTELAALDQKDQLKSLV
jgi:glutaredoxin 3